MSRNSFNIHRLRSIVHLNYIEINDPWTWRKISQNPVQCMYLSIGQHFVCVSRAFCLPTVQIYIHYLCSIDSGENLWLYIDQCKMTHPKPGRRLSRNSIT